MSSRRQRVLRLVVCRRTGHRWGRWQPSAYSWLELRDCRRCALNEERERSKRPAPRGWWTLSGECFIEALRRAHAGEEPELVYAEWYANSDVEHAGGDDV